ncbi:MAG: thioredoxin domain-containing protein, partial [Clostridiales bacterium]|nr:thioredoxin domain-containing protein [Clostridiales bacterium]
MTNLNNVSNRLIYEKSPYLLQHAYNPVDWYPWRKEAFDKAKKEDKPIFLSIGYSTCHWCHVMERESFEDEEVAEILNKHYVSIKVDRDERPDIDHIYMEVCQLLTGSGGWPLTIIMTPDKEPFFVGTYFPKKSSYGHIGLKELLEKINDIWQKQRDKLLSSADSIIEVLSRTENKENKSTMNEDTIEKAYKSLSNNFDEKYGGVGAAPKFPMPHNIMFLLRYYRMTKEEKALKMTIKTLESMYRGGIYDHLGFGFSRYSTDKKWLVPH